MRFLLLSYIKEFSECCIEFPFVLKWADMATLDKDDLKAIQGLIEVTIDEAIEQKLVTKEDISHLPTKDEFYEKMDEVMGELKTIREEQTLLSHH
jgi:hypothetical protein